MTDMETNVDLGCVHSNVDSAELITEPTKSCSWSPEEVEKSNRASRKDYCFNVFITIIAVTALLLVLIFLSFFLVHYAAYQQLLQSNGIEPMQLLLNSSNKQLQVQASELKEAQHFIHSLQLQLNSSHEQLQLQASGLKDALLFIQSLQLQLNKTVKLQESLQTDFQNFLENQGNCLNELVNQSESCNEPNTNRTLNSIHSCSDLPQSCPSGYYHIKMNNSSVQVFCDINSRKCGCSNGKWGMRVANLDMTDPTQNCPDEFRQVIMNRTTGPPLRMCGRSGPAGCVSTIFPTHGIEYSRVCGRVIGYQYSTPDAFLAYINGINITIDSVYVDGVSLTHGQSPRQHIWTFVSAVDESQAHGTHNSCPCVDPGRPFVFEIPPFIGQDYFCDSGNGGRVSYDTFFNDPLWDGQGCRRTSACCEFNNPPWFCKQLPQPTTDDIELRLCHDELSQNEDILIDTVELYVI